MIQVVLYARISDDDKRGDSASINGQLRQMREYATKRNWKIYREFTDQGISGRNDQRPGFQELITLAQNPPEILNAVLVWNFSRFSRSYQDARLYRAVLRRYHLEVISTTQSYDAPLIRLLDALAEYYCDNISQYTKMAMRERILQGYCYGGIPPFGYLREYEGDSNKAYLVPDPKYAPVVEKIFELFLAGHKVGQIAEILEQQNIRDSKNRKWTYGKVQRILKNAVYMGKLCWGKGEQKICIPQAHHAIVSQEVFQEAQKAMRR